MRLFRGVIVSVLVFCVTEVCGEAGLSQIARDGLIIKGGDKLRALAGRLPPGISMPQGAVGDWYEATLSFQVVPAKDIPRENERFFQQMLRQLDFPLQTRKTIEAVTPSGMTVLTEPGGDREQLNAAHVFSVEWLRVYTKDLASMGAVVRRMVIKKAKYSGVEEVQVGPTSLNCHKVVIEMAMKALTSELLTPKNRASTPDNLRINRLA